MLRTVMETAPDDLFPAVYLLACRIPPAHEGLELGIVDAVIRKAIVLTFGVTKEHIMELLKDHKDLDVATSEISKAIDHCLPRCWVVLSDSETIRHLKQVHAKRSTIQTVQGDIEEIYGKYAPFQFLAYWSEMWCF
ncbi:DNA ligase 1 [Phtheirospermum japonicum]|uniref:DNA ligase 1 n=1 Tax=Phtheirospermum japonicum TaxID=374723 RepID=A0A830BTM1_9LAMI|nr:DNA ligase 1 [Phtheirospermum japonicum]